MCSKRCQTGDQREGRDREDGGDLEHIVTDLKPMRMTMWMIE